MSVPKHTPTFSIFSVIKNVGSREAMFRRCIESVLSQTFGDFEFVIQDGGSNDNTADIVAEYPDRRIRFLSEPDSCGEEGFFRALKRCRGRYIGSCLSDEELYPDALENALRAFEENPHIAAFYGNVSYVNEKGQKWGPRVPPHPFSIEAYVCQELVPPFCSSFFQRDALEKMGLHEHPWRYRIGEFEFWIRTAGAGDIIYLPYNISYFGRHSQSHTRSVAIYDEMLVERERVMSDIFQENPILQRCNVTVEQALAGNFAWAATSVLNLEGASERCLSFMRKAEHYAPQCRQLAQLKTRIQSKPMTHPTPNKPTSDIPPTTTFGRWIDALAAMDHRLYYRDQSPETLTSLWSLARRFDPTVIVELGTLGGLSLRTWLAASERAKVVAIDLSFAKLAQTRRTLPVDLSRVALLEQDILKVDFSRLWTAQDRVALFVDAHDLPNVPIMQHVLMTALPSLPDGSLVVVDDLWFSEQTLTRDNAEAFLARRVVNEIDELQCFKGYFAPYHEGGSFMGFAEVLPLLDFVNRYRIKLMHEEGSKHVHFVWDRACLSAGSQSSGWVEPDSCRGMVPYNPLETLPVLGPAREIFRQIVDAYPKGNKEQIAEYLRQLVSEYPRESGLRYAYAVVLARLGMLSQARDVLAVGSCSANHPRYQRLFDDLVQYVGPRERSRCEISQATKDGQGLTLFALPKPFVGDIAVIQKNAIRSWARLSPSPEIILFGDEPGTREMAAEIGARHIPQIDCNEFGTPLVDRLFQTAQTIASNNVITYVNADIVLFQNFIDGMQKVQTSLPEFLLVGQRWDLSVLEEIDFDRPDWLAKLQREMQEHAMIHPESGLDYFGFRKGLWSTIPPFALGRTAWDNWLIMDPSNRGVPVVDGTEYITAVHQDHDYGHMAGGREEAWKGAEAQRNRALAGKIVGAGHSSDAQYMLNREGKLLKTEPRQAWCNTALYKDRRSIWLLGQADRLFAVDKNELAVCKCEEASAILRYLLELKQVGHLGVKPLDGTTLAQRYVSGCLLQVQCYLKMGHHDRAAAICTSLLEEPCVKIGQEARGSVKRLRDLAVRLSCQRPLSANGTAGESHLDPQAKMLTASFDGDRSTVNRPSPSESRQVTRLTDMHNHSEQEERYCPQKSCTESPSVNPSTALIAGQAELVNSPISAKGYHDALTDLETKYEAMPFDAPGKQVTAIRLAELCRRIGQTEKSDAYALQALKIKNKGVIADAGRRAGTMVIPSDNVPRPRVTVVTACHNAERYLAEALDSVIGQSLTEWELFLLDDASTDGTREIMAEYAARDGRIKTFTFDSNAGPYVRRNFAIDRANSDFIVIHDSDDLMVPNKLERLYETICSDRRLVIVGAWYRTFFERFIDVCYTDSIDLPLDHETIAEYARSWKHGVSHGAAIIRKSMFERIGGYDANAFSSDAFWSAKLAEYIRHDPNARFMNVAEYLTLYRVHSVSQTQILSTFDPRNRRVRFRGYCRTKLARIREKMETVPGTDIARELRECSCSDFLTRFKAQIIAWENEPLDQNIVAGLLRNAVEAFNGGCYVSCMSVLSGVEAMDHTIARRIVGFNLLRGMALFALRVTDKSAVFLEQEIECHDSSAARAFVADAFERAVVSSVPGWCQENAGSYDLGLSLAPARVAEPGALAAGTARK